jgi:hypothetical protein
MTKHFSAEELQSIRHAIARLRASVMAAVFGLLGGMTLFFATLWLVIRGPDPGSTKVGPTLGLLNNYFPGYEVSVIGSLIGLFYGLLSGAIIGWAIAFIYNLAADKRHGPKL